MRAPQRPGTLVESERGRGETGPAPGDDRVEIRWARMDGREVVIKAARDPHRAGLRREAEVIRRLAETDAADCVVAFVELAEGPDHTELVTARHGTVTLAEAPLLGLRERVSALIATCGALATLHRAGWSHGALEPDHVVVAPAATSAAGGVTKVRFCSLGAACEDRTRHGSASRAGDLHALAGLVLDVLTSSDGYGTARDRRRYRSGAREARRRITAARGLRDPDSIAVILTETLGKRMGVSAPAGSDAKSTSGPGSGTPAHHRVRRAENQPERVAARGSRRLSTRSVALLATTFLCAGALTAWFVSGDGSGSATGPRECSVETGSGSHPCSEVLVHSNVVEVGGASFELGRPDDVIMVGDWDCDTEGTAVLLERDSGRLYHFDSWSTAAQQVTGRLLGTFESATDLRDGAPCAYPEVVLADRSAIRPLEGPPASPEISATQGED